MKRMTPVVGESVAYDVDDLEFRTDDDWFIDKHGTAREKNGRFMSPHDDRLHYACTNYPNCDMFGCGNHLR